MLLFGTNSYPNSPSSTRREVWPNYFKKMLKLAQNLISKICANLIDFIKNVINSQRFLERNKKTARTSP